MPAILGVSPWRNAYDVWVSKVYATENLESPAMTRGTFLETGILDWFSRVRDDGTQRKIVRNQYRVSGVLSCSMDAVAEDGSYGVEVKTSSEGSHWGHENTDEVPEYVIVQVQHQMEVTGLPRVYVPCLVAAFGALELREYAIERNERFGRMVRQAAERFWNEHVLKGIEPEGIPSLAVVKSVMRQSGKQIALPDSVGFLLNRYTELGKQVRETEEERDSVQAAILAKLGDAEVGVLSDGRTAVHKEFERTGYTVKPTKYRRLVVNG